MRLISATSLLVLSALSALASTVQFNARQDINTGFQHLTGLAVADFNGDGKPDIAVTDDNNKKVVVYLNSGTGTFSASVSTTIQMTGVGAGFLVAADFNEDGKQDLIIGTIAGLQADIFLAGNGDGTFTQQENLPGSYGFASASAVDINHDSHLDFIAGGNGALYVYLGDGHGNFTQQPNPAGSGDLFPGITSGDFNNDKNIDFLVTAYTGGNLRYYAGNGDGTFAAPSIVSNSNLIFSPDYLASADFNGDGKLDLLLGSANIASIILGNGDGTFQEAANQIAVLAIPPPVTQTPATNPPAVAAADMNYDGKIDVVVADNSSGTVDVFLNDGTGKFPQSTPDFTSTLPSGSGQLQLADLNGDGLPDIIITNYTTQNISIFLSVWQPVTPTVTLTSSLSQSLAGTPVTFTAVVTGLKNLNATGSVTLLDGMSSLSQLALNANGQAAFILSNLAAGQHSLSASYAGDSHYLSASSSVLAQAVTDFQLSLPSSSQTVSRGSTATYNLNLTPIAAFAGNITFTCSGLPAGASCANTTTTLNGQPATVALNITTAMTGSLGSDAHARITESAAILLLSFSLAGIFGSSRRSVPRLIVFLIAAIGIGLTTGCGGGSHGSSGTNTPAPVTTNFTITASATQSGQTVSHQTSASLTID